MVTVTHDGYLKRLPPSTIAPETGGPGIAATKPGKATASNICSWP